MVVENKTDDVLSPSVSQEVMVTLKYEGNSITFPINPDNLKEAIDSGATTENVEGLGEISVPQRPSLSLITFSSFFWADKDETKPIEYVRWIKTWQASRKPARLSVSVIDWDINVTCESFTHWVNAGEEKDIYFDIVLKEYREYGAKKVKIVNGQYVTEMGGMTVVLGQVQVDEEKLNANVAPVMFQTSSVRNNINKKQVPLSVMVGEDESTVSVVRRYSQDGSKSWKELYDENPEELGESITKTLEAAKQTADFTNANKAVVKQISGVTWYLHNIMGLL